MRPSSRALRGACYTPPGAGIPACPQPDAGTATEVSPYKSYPTSQRMHGHCRPIPALQTESAPLHYPQDPCDLGLPSAYYFQQIASKRLHQVPGPCPPMLICCEMFADMDSIQPNRIPFRMSHVASHSNMHINLVDK